jgi:MFS family permease
MVLEWLRASPRAFKVLVASALIENIAFGLILPYLTIYMVEGLEISNTLAGVVLAAYTVSGVPAVILGGMFADKIGRRIVLLISLSLMSVTMMLYFFATGFVTLFAIVLADSFVGSLYMPAANAMIADVIPSRDRPKAYSTLRIAWNSGMFIGPAIGVFIVVAYSIRELFLFGAAILAVAFIVNFILIPETRPKSTEDEEVTFRKVMAVGKNRPFLLLIIMTGCLWFFMTQWMSVLAVYATGESDLGLKDSVPGVLFAINAVMVVTLQLWVTSWMVKIRPSMVLMVGQIIVALGFMTIFFASDFESLLGSIVIITIGEIVYMSIISAVVADMAPESKRGIYMGFMGFVQSLAMGIGFFFGMLLFDVLPDHRYVWIIFGLFGLVTSFGYIAFSRMIGRDKDIPRKAVPDTLL